MHGLRITLAGMFGLGTCLMYSGLAIATLTAPIFDSRSVQAGLALFTLGALFALFALFDSRFTP